MYSFLFLFASSAPISVFSLLTLIRWGGPLDALHSRKIIRGPFRCLQGPFGTSGLQGAHREAAEGSRETLMRQPPPFSQGGPPEGCLGAQSPRGAPRRFVAFEFSKPPPAKEPSAFDET